MNDYKWDEENLVAYRVFINKDMEENVARFRGQTAHFINRWAYHNFCIDYELDYFGLKASDSLNISRDKWNDNFSKKIIKDAEKYTKKYIEDWSSIEKNFIDKLLGYNSSKSNDWKKYKLCFLNKNLLIKDIFLKDNIFLSTGFVDLLDGDISGITDCFIMSGRVSEIFNEFLKVQAKSELSSCTLFESYMGYFDQDDEELDINAIYISPKGNKPPDKINNINIKWDPFVSVNKSFDEYAHALDYDFRSMKRQVESNLKDMYMMSDFFIIRDKKILENYDLLKTKVRNIECIINPYQVDKKVYLLDLENLATYLFYNNYKNSKKHTKEDYLEEIKKLVNDLGVYIEKYDLKIKFKR